MKLKTTTEGDIPTGHKVVFTAHCGDRFWIGHTTSFIWMEQHLRKLFFKLHDDGVPAGELYLPIVKAASKMERPAINLKVEFTHESGYQVLKTELEMLIEWFGKRECLNVNNIPYIPKTTHAKTGSKWLTQNEGLNFRKLLKKYEF